MCVCVNDTRHYLDIDALSGKWLNTIIISTKNTPVLRVWQSLLTKWKERPAGHGDVETCKNKVDDTSVMLCIMTYHDFIFGAFVYSAGSKDLDATSATRSSRGWSWSGSEGVCHCSLHCCCNFCVT